MAFHILRIVKSRKLETVLATMILVALTLDLVLPSTDWPQLVRIAMMFPVFYLLPGFLIRIQMVRKGKVSVLRVLSEGFAIDLFLIPVLSITFTILGVDSLVLR